MKPVRWTDHKMHPTPWREGRSVMRTIYDANEVLIGVMDTGELAALVVDAVNAAHPSVCIAQLSSTKPLCKLGTRGCEVDHSADAAES